MPFSRTTPTEHRERRAAERDANMRALMAPARGLVRGTYAGGCSGMVVEKEEAQRNPTLLAMARGRRCLLLAVEGCHGATGHSTVACHQNEGKGMAQKRPDPMSAWGCGPCHHWLDRSGSPRAEKRRAFDAAHARQIAEWRKVAADPGEPERFRRAARWALEQLEIAA